MEQETLKSQYDRLQRLIKIENIRRQLIEKNIEQIVIDDYSAKYGSDKVNKWTIHVLLESLYKNRKAFEMSLYDYIHLYRNKLKEYTGYDWVFEAIRSTKNLALTNVTTNSYSYDVVYTIYLVQSDYGNSIERRITLTEFDDRNFDVNVNDGSTIKLYNCISCGEISLKENLMSHGIDEKTKKALPKIFDEIWDIIEQNRINLIEKEIKEKEDKKINLLKEIENLDLEIQNLNTKHRDLLKLHPKKGK